MEASARSHYQNAFDFDWYRDPVRSPVGYVRKPAALRTSDPQGAILSAAGCGAIFEDVGARSLVLRPGFDSAISAAKDGGVIVVVGFDRLAGRLDDLIAAFAMLKASNVHLVSLHEHFDSRVKVCPLVLAQQLRLFADRAILVSERYRNVGRPTLLSPQLYDAVEAYIAGQAPLKLCVRRSGVSQATFLRRVADARSKQA